MNNDRVPDIILLAECFPVSDKACVGLIQEHVALRALKYKQWFYFRFPCVASLVTLRQAACQERSGDTRRMNWSWGDEYVKIYGRVLFDIEWTNLDEASTPGTGAAPVSCNKKKTEKLRLGSTLVSDLADNPIRRHRPPADCGLGGRPESDLKWK